MSGVGMRAEYISDSRSICSFNGLSIPILNALLLHPLYTPISVPIGVLIIELDLQQESSIIGQGKAGYRLGAISKIRHMCTELQDTFEGRERNLSCRESLLDDAERRNARLG
jgi:hypothetical protein